MRQSVVELRQNKLAQISARESKWQPRFDMLGLNAPWFGFLDGINAKTPSPAVSAKIALVGRCFS
jgi:hypothetical protein